MNFAETDEQNLLRQSARRFVASAFPFSPDAPLASPDAKSPHWIEMGRLGWLGLPLSEDVGGLALTPADVTILSEELGRGLATEPYVESVLMAGRLVDALGTEAQRQTHLPAAIVGETRLAFAHQEDGTRGVSHVATRAERHSGAWRLSGRKIAAVGVPGADAILLTASTVDQGLSVFLLRPGERGIAVSPYRTIDGLAAADLLLDRAEGERVGNGGDAKRAVRDALDQAGVALAADALGGSARVLELTADYLNTRRQFGQGLSSFQALRHQLAEMVAELEMARAALHLGLWGLSQENAAERLRAVAGAQARVLKAGRFICESGIQLHGGVGMTEGYEVGHHYRRLLATEARLGSVDELLARYSDLS